MRIIIARNRAGGVVHFWEQPRFVAPRSLQPIAKPQTWNPKLAGRRRPALADAPTDHFEISGSRSGDIRVDGGLSAVFGLRTVGSGLTTLVARLFRRDCDQ